MQWVSGIWPFKIHIFWRTGWPFELLTFLSSFQMVNYPKYRISTISVQNTDQSLASLFSTIQNPNFDSPLFAWSGDQLLLYNFLTSHFPVGFFGSTDFKFDPMTSFIYTFYLNDFYLKISFEPAHICVTVISKK